MTPTLAISLCLLIPLTGTLLILVTGRNANLREAVTLTTAGILFALVLWITGQFASGTPVSVELYRILPGLALAFEVEPLGMFFALVASGLWIINSLYAIGYMRGNGEKNQTRFFACFPIAIGAAVGIAYSANLFTMFVFYEILTFSTYPLVAHKQDDEARRGARIYLGVLVVTSICLLLPAIAGTYAAAHTGDFRLGGILDGVVDDALLPILLAMYMFGIGKAALMPFHKWLPAAMVAPTPVSAVLHAVAVVKAGVFCVLKVTLFVFGQDLLLRTGAGDWLIWAAAGTLTLASMIAMTQDNLKARLAYSTVSQLSYVILGAALATSMGLIGGVVQLIMHAFGKITLFYAAGNIYTAAHRTEISDMDGLGWRMPFTYGAMLVGMLSIIGLPIAGGMWSKWYLMSGAADANLPWVMGILALSTLMNVAYLLPVFVRGFLVGPRPMPALSAATTGDGGIREAPALCVIPQVLTAIICIILFFQVGSLVAWIETLVIP